VQAPLEVGVAVGVTGAVLVAVAVVVPVGVAGAVLLAVAVAVAVCVAVGAGPPELELPLHALIASNKTAGRNPAGVQIADASCAPPFRHAGDSGRGSVSLAGADPLVLSRRHQQQARSKPVNLREFL